MGMEICAISIGFVFGWCHDHPNLNLNWRRFTAGNVCDINFSPDGPARGHASAREGFYPAFSASPIAAIRIGLNDAAQLSSLWPGSAASRFRECPVRNR